MRVPALPFSLSVAYIASLFTALHDNCDSSSDMMVYEKKELFLNVSRMGCLIMSV